MNPKTLNAFFNEMGKIKQAGMLRNVGTGLVNFSKKVGNNAKSAVGALMSNPVGAVKAGFNESLNGSGGKLLNAGLIAGGAALGLPDALASEDPSGAGRSRVERMSGWAGEQIGGFAGVPYGFMSGSIASGLVGGAAGSLVGKGIDKVRGYKPPEGDK